LPFFDGLISAILLMAIMADKRVNAINNIIGASFSSLYSYYILVGD
jgi:hypothetical protein